MDNEFLVKERSTKFIGNLQDDENYKPFSQDLLLIEDDKVCLFVGQEILSHLTSGKIDTATTVTEAKEKLKHNRYDLVLSDLCLADGSGMDIISEVQTQSGSKNKNTPFIAVTAYHELNKHQEALSAGFKSVINKPISEDQARMLMKDCFTKRKSRDKTIKRPVIDLQLGMQRIGVYSQEKALQVLELLMISLPEDLSALRNAESKRDRSAINDVTHKLIGALSYSAAPALEEAVQDLQAMLQTNQPSALSAGIQQVTEQVESLKAAYYDLLIYGSY